MVKKKKLPNMKLKLLFALVVIMLQFADPAKKKRKSHPSCPGLPVSGKNTFEDVLHYAAGLSSAKRHMDAHLCFENAIANAATEQDRNIARFNLAVVQKDMQRCAPSPLEFHSNQS